MALSKRDARLKAKTEARAARIAAKTQQERPLQAVVEPPGRTAEERKRQLAEYLASLHPVEQSVEKQPAPEERAVDLRFTVEPQVFSGNLLAARQAALRREREDYIAHFVPNQKPGPPDAPSQQGDDDPSSQVHDERRREVGESPFRQVRRHNDEHEDHFIASLKDERRHEESTPVVGEGPLFNQARREKHESEYVASLQQQEKEHRRRRRACDHHSPFGEGTIGETRRDVDEGVRQEYSDSPHKPMEKEGKIRAACDETPAGEALFGEPRRDDDGRKRAYAAALQMQMADERRRRGECDEVTAGEGMFGEVRPEAGDRKREYAAALQAQMAEERRRRAASESGEARAIFTDHGVARDDERAGQQRAYAAALREQMEADTRRKIERSAEVGGGVLVDPQPRTTAADKETYAAELRRQIAENTRRNEVAAERLGAERQVYGNAELRKRLFDDQPEDRQERPFERRDRRQPPADAYRQRRAPETESHFASPPTEYYQRSERDQRQEDWSRHGGPTDLGWKNQRADEYREVQLHREGLRQRAHHRRDDPRDDGYGEYGDSVPQRARMLEPFHGWDDPRGNADYRKHHQEPPGPGPREPRDTTRLDGGVSVREPPGVDRPETYHHRLIDKHADDDYGEPPRDSRLLPIFTRGRDNQRADERTRWQHESHAHVREKNTPGSEARRFPGAEGLEREAKQRLAEERIAAELREQIREKEARKPRTKAESSGAPPPGYRIGPTGQLVRVDPRDRAGRVRAEAMLAKGIDATKPDCDASSPRDEENALATLIVADEDEEAGRKAKAEAYARQLEADLAAREVARKREAEEAAVRERAEELKLERERAELEAAYKRNEQPLVVASSSTDEQADLETRRRKREDEARLQRLRDAEDDARVEREQRELAARFAAEEEDRPTQGRPASSVESRTTVDSRTTAVVAPEPVRAFASSRSPPTRPPTTESAVSSIYPPPSIPDEEAAVLRAEGEILSLPEAMLPARRLNREAADNSRGTSSTFSPPRPFGGSPRVSAAASRACNRQPSNITEDSSRSDDDIGGWVVPPSREAVYSYKLPERSPPPTLNILPVAAANLEAALESARGRRLPSRESPLARAGATATAGSSRPPSSQLLAVAESCLVFPDGRTVETELYDERAQNAASETTLRPHSSSSSSSSTKPANASTIDLDAVRLRNEARLDRLTRLESAADRAIAAGESSEDPPGLVDDALSRLVAAAARQPAARLGSGSRPSTRDTEDSLPNAVRWAYRGGPPSTPGRDLVVEPAS